MTQKHQQSATFLPLRVNLNPLKICPKNYLAKTFLKSICLDSSLKLILKLYPFLNLTLPRANPKDIFESLSAPTSFKFCLSQGLSHFCVNVYLPQSCISLKSIVKYLLESIPKSDSYLISNLT